MNNEEKEKILQDIESILEEIKEEEETDNNKGRLAFMNYRLYQLQSRLETLNKKEVI